MIKLLDDAGTSDAGIPYSLQSGLAANDRGGSMCLYVTGLSSGELSIQGVVLANDEDASSLPSGLDWEECDGGSITADGCYLVAVRPTHIRAVLDASAPASGVYVRLS